MIEAYMKVLRAIQSAEYQHFKNGTVLNMINNFGNMYNHRDEYNELVSLYNEKLNLFQNN